MQFGGQRTDMNLKPIGQPDNLLIKLTPEILPQPDAVLTHGISPQKTNAKGLSEPEFLQTFTKKIVKPNTVFIGFNNVRFDDEFMRFSFWRNFFDAYEWQWKDGCSRWDLLDMARMTRALRPEGIEWPFAADGKPTVRLESMAVVNQLTHDSAHDALSDVKASIALARLIKLKQPKLFEYLFTLRDKAKVEALVSAGQPIVYTSGRYPSEYLKTSVVTMVGPTSGQPGALMFDLRVDPEPFLTKTPPELANLWALRGPESPYFPIKVLRYNRSPAVASLAALDRDSAKRLNINLITIKKNNPKVRANKGLTDRLNQALEIMHPPRQPMLVSDIETVDAQLYDGFISGPDKIKLSVVRATTANTINDTAFDFEDVRLAPLLQLYKARNFPEKLSSAEAGQWRRFRKLRLSPDRTEMFFKRIDELQKIKKEPSQLALLKELADYGHSLLAT